jgi:histone acetyltransferase (RNA polymerase elongator complex component)
MKSHSIIPIFLPELGCPKQCVFCNQRHISGQPSVPDETDVEDIIEQHISSLASRNIQTEIAFFGGSFTALDAGLQEQYLKVAQPYLQNKTIRNIRLSTRPDAITDENLQLLNQYGVSIIELGVQSLDDEVLRLSGRGYTSAVVYEAAEKIIKHGFTLGMQMMIGLPGSTPEKDLLTAKEIIRCGAKGTRIYPLLVFRDTDLEQLYTNNEYTPLTVEEAVEQSADLLELFLEAGVQVYKVGLHPSEFLYNGTLLAGPWIPAFRQHVQARVWQRKFEKELTADTSIQGFAVHPSDINSAVGPNRCNAKYFKEKEVPLLFRTDPLLNKGDFYAFYS